MSKILLDTICDKCGHTEEAWYTPKGRDVIISGAVSCKDCEDPESTISIVIGKPQFQLKRGCGGYHSPGKH